MRWSIASRARSGGRRSFFGRSAGAALSAFVLLGAEILAFAAAVAMAQPAAAATDPVVAAAGDIGCDPTTNIVANCAMNDTANLIKGMAPGYLLPLGDVQYTDNLPQGTPPTPSMYTDGYDRAWGTIPAAVPGISVNPTAGNHDWGDPNDTNNAPSGNLANYIGYFASKGQLRPGVTSSQPWYSFDIPVNGGTWHAISLDNECGANGGCGTGSPMETFLKNDLAAHPNVCTLAYWHRPRFSSGAIGSRPEYAALWTDLYNARASIVLAGSDHDYERFNRQDPNANATSTGIAQYVVGTGGAFLPGNFGAIKANSAFRDANDFGVLALTLHANSYDFAFRTTGGTTPDSGTGVACSNPAGPPGPAVSSLNPASGPASGGTAVTINGSNLTGATAVKFGANSATNVQVVSSTQITATSPAGTQGATVDVTVTTPGGTSAVSAADRFTYQSTQPAVTGVSPASGAPGGGTAVTITGLNLSAATAVRFGATSAAGFNVVSPTQITATSPAGTVGTTVDVTVTTPNGTSATSSADRFTFGSFSTPSVAGVSPISGASTGGTPMSITGAGFSGATAVKFGSVAASSFTVNSSGLLTATAPPGTTTVDVTVTNPAGTSAVTPADEYTYTFANNGYAVSLAASTTTPAVGGSVALTATANKDVGPTPYGLSILDVTTGVEVIHAGSGTTLSTSVSQSAASTHRYVGFVSNANAANAQAASTPIVVNWGATTAPPSVTGVSPSSGPPAGGTTVTISGSSFGGATAVRFGAANAGFTVVSPTSITTTSPGGTGTVDVTVTTPAGTSANTAADNFAYAAPTSPSVTGVSPSSGPAAGGTAVTITGTSFTGATVVRFGSVAATSFTVNADTQISATSPAGAAGTWVDVTVGTPNGTSPISAADSYTYLGSPPTVAGVSPSAGPAAGGTSVVVTGANFTGATVVRFGSVAATSFTVNTDTQISATSPAGIAGTWVDVTVGTPNGTSPISAADSYTYLGSPPTVAGVSPSAGPAAGGTSVVVTGANFTGATAVRFGSVAATAFTVNADTQISATSPAGIAGVVDVTVTTPGGASPTSSADRFTYVQPAPTVTGISPAGGPTIGGTVVTISGANFTPGTPTVSFGANAGSVTAFTATSITVTAPAGAQGAVDVTVTTPAGTSPPTSADRFTYASGSSGPPSVTGVSPISGPSAGGTPVAISGVNLLNATSVQFGSVNAASFTVNSATSITAAAPAGTTTVDVVVVTPQGTSPRSADDQYSYTFSNNGYSITLAASTTSPAVGGSATLTGTANKDVGPTPYGMSVFDVTTGTELIHTGSGTTISTVVSQASAVKHRYIAMVSNGGGANAQAASAPVVIVWGGGAAPSVSGLSPSSGSTAGGTSVAVTGTNLTGATAVMFGSVNAASFTVNSATSITATAPAGSAGTVDVTVTTPGGTSAASAADRFTYVTPAGPPAVTGVGPASGPVAGGTVVTISGTNFTGATAVAFGASSAAFTVNSATSITATAPAGSAGAVDVLVTGPQGTSTAGTADRFTYVAAPAVSGISPSSGSTAGGTSVAVTGINLTGATAVMFGSVNAASFTVNSATSITGTAPAGSAGTVDVTVTTPGGTSAAGTADRFTYVAAPPPVPAVTSISPNTGPTTGGTIVTITGTGLAGATAARFGAANATSFTVVSGGSIRATAPGGAQGAVDVTVTTPGGTSAVTAADTFTYVTGSSGSPTVTGVGPISGPSAGGTSVVVSGTNFLNATAVLFGTANAASFTVNSATRITATAPAGTTTVDVSVTTPQGTSARSAADQYTYTFSNNGYSITLSASSTSPSVGGSVTLTGTANKDVGPTPYGMSILDVTTGTELVHTGSGATISTTVSQSAASTHRYVAMVSNRAGANAQAVSIPVVVTWG